MGLALGLILRICREKLDNGCSTSKNSLNKSIDEDVNFLNEIDKNCQAKIQLKLTYERKSSNLAINM